MRGMRVGSTQGQQEWKKDEGRRKKEEEKWRKKREKRKKGKKDVVMVAVPLKEGRECALCLHHQAPANETREPCATRWLARLLPRTTYFLHRSSPVHQLISLHNINKITTKIRTKPEQNQNKTGTKPAQNQKQNQKQNKPPASIWLPLHHCRRLTGNLPICHQRCWSESLPS